MCACVRVCSEKPHKFSLREMIKSQIKNDNYKKYQVWHALNTTNN